jgi:hypothetical protein
VDDPTTTQPTTEPPALIVPADHSAPTHPLAATEMYGRSAREQKLVDQCQNPAWGYEAVWAGFVGISLAVSAGAKYAPDIGVRMIGPGLIGLSWGGLVGGAYLSLPKCHSYYANGAPPEGSVGTTIPIAIALSVFAGATAPILVGLDTGPLPAAWSTEERAARVVMPIGFGILGAFVPYIPFLAPRTWRAARELEKLRIEPAQNGAMVGWSTNF